MSIIDLPVKNGINFICVFGRSLVRPSPKQPNLLHPTENILPHSFFFLNNLKIKFKNLTC
jgi:hypothetical protein